MLGDESSDRVDDVWEGEMGGVGVSLRGRDSKLDVDPELPSEPELEVALRGGLGIIFPPVLGAPVNDEAEKTPAEAPPGEGDVNAAAEEDEVAADEEADTPHSIILLSGFLSKNFSRLPSALPRPFPLPSTSTRVLYQHL